MEEKENKKPQGLFGFVHGAVDSVKNTVSGIKLPEIKLPEIKLPNPFQGRPQDKEENRIPSEIKSLSSKSAISMVYYMMMADGEIHPDEEITFNDIGKELDPEYEQHKDQIVEECRKQINKVIDENDYAAVLQDGTEEAILSGANLKESFITPRMLLWDLLTVAYSDGNYSEQERILLKYIVRKLNIPKEVFLEMENSYLAVMEIEQELKWIKTTNRQYLTIETIVNELADRKMAILDSIKDLIAL